MGGDEHLHAGFGQIQQKWGEAPDQSRIQVGLRFIPEQQGIGIEAAIGNQPGHHGELSIPLCHQIGFHLDGGFSHLNEEAITVQQGLATQ